MVIINVYYQDVDRRSEYPTKSYCFFRLSLFLRYFSSIFYLHKYSHTVSRLSSRTTRDCFLVMGFSSIPVTRQPGPVKHFHLKLPKVAKSPSHAKAEWLPTNAPVNLEMKAATTGRVVHSRQQENTTQRETWKLFVSAFQTKNGPNREKNLILPRK